MALSNWAVVGWTGDLLYFDPRIVTRSGYVIEVYKDWICVKEPNSETIFFTIHEGQLDFDGVFILAKHISDPTNAVVVCMDKHYPREGESKEKYFGIGCYGFDKRHPDADEDGWVGIQDGHINALREMINADEESGVYSFEEAPTLEEFKKNMVNKNLSTAILGWSLRGDFEL